MTDYPLRKLAETHSIHEKAEIIVAIADIEIRDANQFVKDVEGGKTAGQSINDAF